jgi:hypothetical protein
MSTLSRRLAKLEGTNGDDDLVVLIQQFGVAGEYDRVKGYDDQMIERLPQESEEAFLDRARDEIVSATKKAIGAQPCYVMQPLRKGERVLETVPQPRPTVSKDEWLTAHGLQPVTKAQE